MQSVFTVSIVTTGVNLKLLMPSTGYLRDLHIAENPVASSWKQPRCRSIFLQVSGVKLVLGHLLGGGISASSVTPLCLTSNLRFDLSTPWPLVSNLHPSSICFRQMSVGFPSDKQRSADPTRAARKLNHWRTGDNQRRLCSGLGEQQVAGASTIISRQTCCSTTIKYSAAYVSLFSSDELPEHEAFKL